MPVVTKEPEGTSTPYKGVTFSYDGGPLLSNQAIKDRKEWLKTNQWDTISIGRHIPSNVKYMVVDVETHDWNSTKARDYSTGRVVELAWMLVDAKDNCIEQKQYLIKPYGYEEISNKAVEVHGITTETAVSHGSEAELVFGEFVSVLKTLPPDGFVISYNMEHEHTVFMNSFDKEQFTVWDSVPKCDTNPVSLWKYLPDEADPVYKKTYKSRNYGTTLNNLHRIMYPNQKDSNEAHFASNDVKKTWDIFRHYKQYATNYELKWKHRNIVPSTKYSGISVVTNVGSLNRY